MAFVSYDFIHSLFNGCVLFNPASESGLTLRIPYKEPFGFCSRIDIDLQVLFKVFIVSYPFAVCGYVDTSFWRLCRFLLRLIFFLEEHTN